ncbi:hypothetical protein K3495_g8661 [Podosphaera aphanis]|nr:hypothetical protein K3495_g8661 [Podosphaera aphanis]
MAATLPRPSRSSYGPSTTTIPSGVAKKIGCISSNSSSASESPTPGQANRMLRTPISIPNANTLNGRSTPVSKQRKASGIGTGPAMLRKDLTVNEFPQPPGTNRTTNLPPSPLSGGNQTRNHGKTSQLKRSETSDTTSLESNRSKNGKVRSPKQSVSYSITPSTMNGGDDARSIDSAPGRGIEHSANPSPSQSFASADQDYYCKSVATHEQSSGAETKRESHTDLTLGHSSAKVSEAKGNVIVSVRVRPDAGTSTAGKTEGEWMVDGRRSLVAYRGKEGGDYYYGIYLFRDLSALCLTHIPDNVFTTHDNNAKVYDSSAKRLVRRVMEGYHGTVFAYGMTGTGKTFSMQGTATSPGVIPLAITDIFSYIRETPGREFLLRVSYLEIYNEKIHDLLSPPCGTGPGATQPEEIKLREDSKRGVYASSLKEEIVQSPTQLLRVIARGDQARRTSSTQFNSRSSRSHAVVQIVVESRERIPGSGSMGDSKRSALAPSGVRVSTLSLIDLAGSERAAETKERRTEGSHINKSLLTLGTVIAKLSGEKDKDGKPTDKDGKHLPYRDSKLTRLLQGALSGDSLVSILCTIQIGSAGSSASSSTHTNETLNTLKFASRAKNNIISHAKKAEEALGLGGDGGARVLLERYRMEILELRSQLENQAKAKVDDDEREREKEAENRHEEQMLEMHLARTALKERIEHLNRLILSSKSMGVNTGRSYSSLSTNPRISSSSASAIGYNTAMSTRTSLTHSTLGRRSLERTGSQNSISTVSEAHRQKINGERNSQNSLEDEDSLGEFADGNASLAAQNRALQADLADKTRYCQTLEKRLIQARRSSHSRTSVGFSNLGRNIMVGEDHNVAALLKEKDAEISELRARLNDKDRLLIALRNSARSRDLTDRDSRSIKTPSDDHITSNSTGELFNSQYGLSYSASLSCEALNISNSTNETIEKISSQSCKRSKSVEEMSKILDDMIQDRIENGLVAKDVSENRGRSTSPAELFTT